jgi:hypothetical protein
MLDSFIIFAIIFWILLEILLVALLLTVLWFNPRKTPQIPGEVPDVSRQSPSYPLSAIVLPHIPSHVIQATPPGEQSQINAQSLTNSVSSIYATIPEDQDKSNTGENTRANGGGNTAGPRNRTSDLEQDTEGEDHHLVEGTQT